jgi:hypothetical protein
VSAADYNSANRRTSGTASGTVSDIVEPGDFWSMMQSERRRRLIERLRARNIQVVEIMTPEDDGAGCPHALVFLTCGHSLPARIFHPSTPTYDDDDDGDDAFIEMVSRYMEHHGTIKDATMGCTNVFNDSFEPTPLAELRINTLSPVHDAGVPLSVFIMHNVRHRLGDGVRHQLGGGVRRQLSNGVRHGHGTDLRLVRERADDDRTLVMYRASSRQCAIVTFGSSLEPLQVQVSLTRGRKRVAAPEIVVRRYDTCVVDVIAQLSDVLGRFFQ